MKKLLILLFSVFLYANDLVDLVDNFANLNSKINELNNFISEDKEEDSQNKLKINQEIKDLKANKSQILAIFPTLMSYENLNKNILKELKKQETSKDLKTAKSGFYECLLEIIDYVNTKDSEKPDLKNLIDEHLKELNSIKSNDNDKTKIDSLIEILTYLRLNTDIFNSNDIFKQFDTNKYLNQFNSYFPKEINNIINPGKIILCFLIMFFIFAIKKLILKILFIIILKIFKKSHDDHSLHLLEKLTRPIILSFYTYGLWLCALISFYPAPVMPIILTLFSIANTIILTWLIITILNGYGVIIISKIAQKSGKKEVINLMLKIAYFIVIIIAILVILAKLGFDISAIIASLGIGGLAVALAAKDIIANFFASVLVLFDNSFSQGDWVIVDGIEGTIVETGLRKTAIRTFDNSLVFVPNSKIMNANIKNWSKRKLGRKIGLTIGVEYSVSKEQLEKILNDLRIMLKNHPDIAQPQIDTSLQDKNYKTQYRQNMVSVDDLDGYKNTLFVYLDEFADSSINIVIYCFSKTIIWGEFLKVKEDVMLKVMQILEENKAGFAFPSTSLYVEKLPEK